MNAPAETPRADGRCGRKKRRGWEAIALLLITLLSAALRLHRLPDVPPGLHYDEAFNGVSARTVLEERALRIFFADDMGEEPLAISVLALALAVLGDEPWIIRLVSAIAGILTVPLAWWLGRGLYRRPLPALGTALVLAILYWHVSFSRIGMEPIWLPFFATLAFAALLHGLRDPHRAPGLPQTPASNAGAGHGPRWALVLAGLALGGSLYTYKAGYFVPLLAAVFVACAALLERDFVRRNGRGLLLVAAVALLVAAPLLAYFASNPAHFMQRPASVALNAGGDNPQESLPALAANLPRVLGMFFLRGDANPRSNLPGRPVLDPFLALLFVAGLARAIARFGRPREMLPALWLGVMIVPTLVTTDAPHFGRAIGATPAVAALCAGGLAALASWTAALGRLRPAPARASGGSRMALLQTSTAALLVLGLISSGLSTARDYFQAWARSGDLFYAYDVGLVQVAGYVEGLPAAEKVYLTPTPGDHYTLQYLLKRQVASFDGRAGHVFPPALRSATQIVVVAEDGASLPALQSARPDGAIAWTLEDRYGRPYAVAYHLPARADPAPVPPYPVQATLGTGVRLLGYALDAKVVAPGEVVHLVLYWQALEPMAVDYTVFTHLLGENNPASGGPLWAGHDGQPDAGRYPTSAWQPGEIVLDVHPLAIPPDTPPGEYSLQAGLYLLASMERVPAWQAAGERLPEDAVPLGNVGVMSQGGEH
jgi:4-amino-4-deoxy-L-arabinose transferase-like glycosyltransferase